MTQKIGINVDEVFNTYIERLMNNPQRFQQYMKYLVIAEQVITDRFGPNPDWSNIPIQEKCYHGWLRPYGFLLETIINGRWAYWHDIRETKEVRGKPIPQLHFYKPYNDEYKIVSDMLMKCLRNPYTEYRDEYRTFVDFIDWLLYGWGSPLVKEINISPEVQKYWYENFNAGLMFLYPAEYFGELACSAQIGRGSMFFPTPAPVVECMVQMVYSDTDPEEAKYMTVNEPCCGAGIMLLYQSNYSLRLYAQDISPLLVKITTLNGYFYVPWLVETDDEINKVLEQEYQRIKREKEKGIGVIIEDNGQLKMEFKSNK